MALVKASFWWRLGKVECLIGVFFPTNPSQIEWDLTNGPLSVSCDWAIRYSGLGGPFSGSCWRFLGYKLKVAGRVAGFFLENGAGKFSHLLNPKSWVMVSEWKMMFLRISMGWFLGSMLFLFYSFSHNHENGKQLHLKGNDSIGALPWLREEG